MRKIEAFELIHLYDSPENKKKIQKENNNKKGKAAQKKYNNIQNKRKDIIDDKMR